MGFAHIIRCYTRESGVRNLERELAKIARKVAKKQVESGEAIEVWMTPENLSELLGPEKYLIAIKISRLRLVLSMVWRSRLGAANC